MKQSSQQEIDETQNTEVAGFISKTFQILNNQQFSKIIYWSPFGDEFIIKDVNKFQQVVLPRFFRHNKMNSFIRQLNMYGFHKSRTENSKSIFSHPLFLRGREDLLLSIKRKVKGKLEMKTELSSTRPQLETPNKNKTSLELRRTTMTRNFPSESELIAQPKSITFDYMCNPSNTLICQKSRLGSLQNCSREILQDQQQDEHEDGNSVISIEDKIDIYKSQFEIIPNNSSSRLYINPSCFFGSIKDIKK